MVENFYSLILTLLEGLRQQIGVELDVRLTGQSIANAVHLDIDQGIEAVVRTERRIAPRMQVDLRELVQVQPPVGEKNLFVTFTAESADFQGWNATAFGIHLTRLDVTDPALQSLQRGVFVPGETVADTYRLLVFLRSPSGEAQLARTGALIGLDAGGRLVAYQTFAFNPGLMVAYHPPSRLDQADPSVMLYIFLTLAVFLMVNQNETPLRWVDEHHAVVG